MTTTAEGTATQIYEIYIKARPQAIWDAITDPAWNARYGYPGAMEYELRPGGAFRAHASPDMVQMGMPEVVIDGEVLEADPPRRLVQTYRFLFSEAMAAEGFTRITWEIEPSTREFSRLRVVHELENAPTMASMVSSPFSESGTGGWSWILSDLKSLLETGSTLSPSRWTPGGAERSSPRPAPLRPARFRPARFRPERPSAPAPPRRRR